MRKPLIVVLALTLALGACGRIRDSRLNPFNWFEARATQVERVEPQADATAADERALMAQVTHVTFDPYPGGVILRATGLPPTQGWWSAELVARPLDEDGVQVYDFRVFAPPGAPDVGPARSREITAAVSIPDIRMAQIRRVVVQGASNAMGAGR